MCGLFIRQNTAMKSEHNTKLFIKTNDDKHVEIFCTCELHKDMYDSKRCTLFTVF